MKKYLTYALIIIFVVVFILVLMELAHRGKIKHHAKPPMQISNVLNHITKAGYSDIQTVVFKNGAYQAIGNDFAGNKVKIMLDPKTGAIKSAGKSTKIMPILMVAHKVEAAGYYYIYSITFEHKYYLVKCLNRLGRIVQLKVDAKTYDIQRP